MTDYDLASCIHDPNVRQVTMESSQGRLQYQNINGSMPTFCNVTLQVVPGLIVHLQVDVCRFMTLRITRKFLWITAVDCQAEQHSPSLYSFTNTLSIIFYVDYIHRSESTLSLSFSAVDVSQRPNLQLIFLTPSQGFIQTPGWDGSTPYLPYIDACVTLTLPPDHVIFFSFLSLDLGFGDFTVHQRGQCVFPAADSRHSSGLVGRGQAKAYLFPPRPSSLLPQQNTLLSVYFTSNEKHQFTGFQIRFSFHHKDRAPQAVSSLPTASQWNCSVSVWPELAEHFPCDLLPQCAQSEDEARCPYTSDTCGPGKLDSGGRCYTYRAEGPRSWFDADRQCRQMGSLLVSVETPQKWRDILSLLKHGRLESTWMGLRESRHLTTPVSAHMMYRSTWHWESMSVAYFLDLEDSKRQDACGTLKAWVLSKSSASYTAFAQHCGDAIVASILCELTSSSYRHNNKPVTLPQPSSSTQSRVPLVTCPLQHVTQAMLACDVASVCWTLDSSEGWHSNGCPMSLHSTQQPYFYCGLSAAHFVPYSLVCDFHRDCSDGADEDFCVHLACTGDMINCGQGQCVNFQKVCDGYADCATKLDENTCPYLYAKVYTIRPPAVVHFDRPGGFTVTPLPDSTTQCPDTHFQCHHDGYCLPVYVRCNNVNDCPDHEDELWCNGYRCPGFYRCRGTDRTVCVHVNHLCDGRPQCPQQDDELMCDVTCPDSCLCDGLALTCTDTVQVSSFPQLRYLEARGSGLHQSDVTSNFMLIHLGVQACGWDRLADFPLPNLHSLDLSHNLIHHINFNHLVKVLHLRRLSLAGNPLSINASFMQTINLSPTLMFLNLSQLLTDSLNMEMLSTQLPNLHVLDLSQSGIKSLQGQPVFQTLSVLNLLACPVSDFSPDIMRSMNNLQRVFVDNFKLCCPVVLPDKFKGECFAPTEDISSCDDLLKSGVYRSALVVTTVCAMIANFSSFMYRVCFSAHKIKTGFAVFVLHLCVSDFFMGVYLAIIGVADQVFSGAYVWSETTWKRSRVCNVAGFLSFLSSEVSAFIVCLITLDRFLVLRFPFSQVRFGTTSAHSACVIVWVLGLILATVPLLPVTSHWEFYHQTGICIPLPVTRADFAGHSYSFSVMIVCNLVLFLLIAVGQSLIYWSVRANAMPEQRKKDMNTDTASVKSKEAIIARRLLTVAMSDFLCWFPIGLCGLLAAVDVVIPGEVNVAMAIFVLPLNSALNPFLYTVNVILEKRQKAKELRFHKFLQAYLKK